MTIGSGEQMAARRIAASIAVMAMAMALSVPAWAQTADYRNFQLQPQPTQTPRAAGPVAPNGEIPRPATAASTPAPAPATSARPATGTAAQPAAAPTPAPTRSPTPKATTPSPARSTPEPSRSPAPLRTAAASATPTSATQAPEAVAPASSEPNPPSTLPSARSTPDNEAEASPPAPGEPQRQPWLLILGGVAVLLFAASAAWSALRRWNRAEDDSAVSFTARELDEDGDGDITSKPDTPQREALGNTAEPLPEPIPAAPIVVTATRAADTPAVSLEARRMSATLVNATLTYRLTITNTGSEPLENMEIGGDMIAAHATRSTEEQLASGTTVLPGLHYVASLAPGESVTLGGDIRLPLAAIRPIRHGQASLFVPLARFSASWTCGDGARKSRASTFLVGQLPAGVSDRLQPFRLDLGPRMYGELGQRQLAGIS